MAFRESVRSKVLVWCGIVLINPEAIVHVAPETPDALDDAIARVASRVLAGAQHLAFCLRYFGNDADPTQRRRMEEAYAKRQFSVETDKVASTDKASSLLQRNANRALQRLNDVLEGSNGSEHRHTILQGWKDAQENAQRRAG